MTRTETDVAHDVMDAWVMAELLHEEIVKSAEGPRVEILARVLVEQLKNIHHKLAPEGAPR